MSYLTRQMEDAYLERQWRGEIDAVKSELSARLDILEQPTNPAITNTASPNYLPNSHPEWSYKAYLFTGVDATDSSDDNNRAYNWEYRASTDFNTTVSPAQNILSENHSAYSSLPASAPEWLKVEGALAIGAANEGDTLYDLVAKLPTDFLFPGQKFYISFEARLNILLEDYPGFNEEEAQIVVGFYDGYQEQWITGNAFTPTASVFGVAGTRTFKYKILATTDTGYQILSNEVTVNNVPNTLDSGNHVRLFFSGAPGFIQFEIFRQDNANVFRKVADIRNSIDLQFFDVQENAGSIADGYPTVTDNAPQAVARTADLPGEDNFAAYTFGIQVPTTYDRTQTPNGNQFFRVGLDKAVGANRSIMFRRFMISEGYGSWTRAALDMGAKSSPVLIATSDPGPGIILGPITNGPTCVELDTLIDVWENGEIVQIPMRDVEVGTQVVSGWQALTVKATKEGVVQQVIEIVTNGGKRLVCSTSHRLITSITDRRGKAASQLLTGDSVLVDWDGIPRQEKIISRTMHFGSFVVKSITLPAPHLYTTNGFISHNTKEDPNPYQPGFNTAFEIVP